MTFTYDEWSHFSNLTQRYNRLAELSVQLTQRCDDKHPLGPVALDEQSLKSAEFTSRKNTKRNGRPIVGCQIKVILCVFWEKWANMTWKITRLIFTARSFISQEHLNQLYKVREYVFSYKAASGARRGLANSIRHVCDSLLWALSQIYTSSQHGY